MTSPLTLSNRDARRLAVKSQLLSTPRPATILDVVRGLGEIQVDPTAAVARTEHLVLWSRLGRSYRPDELLRLLYRDRELFEYVAHIYPVSDYALLRPWMRGYASGTDGRQRYVRRWLAANDEFRRYVLRELRRRGPLPARELEDRVAEGWQTGGWNDGGRSVAMMLEALWRQGRITIAGRDGAQRLWDLAERSLPVRAPAVPSAEAARVLVERRLRAAGFASSRELCRFFWSEIPGGKEAIRPLIRDAIAVPASIDGMPGEWLVHAEVLARPFRPRTALLSPFDDLISNRTRAERLFGFRHRLEIYVPKAKRIWGYYVLPLLHGDRMIGRIDPLFDRQSKVLTVHEVYAEPDAPAAAGPAVTRAIHDLASWLGAVDVRFGRTPPTWRAALAS
jgi:uncharacterized protein YcaQ